MTSLAQSNDDGSEPEKVHDLLPLEYENRANTNNLDGASIKRTTFYA